MRFASACLVSLVVAYTCFGQNDESAPECPKSACARSACPQAAASSACAKTACAKTNACPTASGCPQTSHCPSSSVTACAQPSACANAVTSTKTAACESNTACANAESIADCAASRVAARVALAQKLAACQVRTAADAIVATSNETCPTACGKATLPCTTTAADPRALSDKIARHPELLGVVVRTASADCETAKACAAKGSPANNCEHFECAAQKTCAASTACKTECTNACGVSVKLVEVNLTHMRKHNLHLAGTIDSLGDESASAPVIYSDPSVLEDFLADLQREGAARILDLPQIPTDCENTFHIKRPESFSHVAVHATCPEVDVIQVNIQPCPPDVHIPVPEYAEVGHTYCELNASVRLARGEAAVLGGRCFPCVRVQKMVGPTQSKVVVEREQCQTLFIVTCPAAQKTSLAKQVSHAEPGENAGVSVCPTACEKSVLKTAAQAPCEKSTCQSASNRPTATCPSGACPKLTNCDSVHTPACHAATGVAASTCPLTTDVQLLTACEAAKACAAKTATVKACQQKKSCDTQTATACSKVSSCPATAACQAAACSTATACEKKLACDASADLPALKCDKSRCDKKTQCDQVEACPTAVAAGKSLIQPATPFLAEAVATDAASACASGACASVAAACCERNKNCTAGACCRQGEAAVMASATDEPCATEACAEAPCAGAAGAVLSGVGINSDAGCLGAIACDSDVQAPAAPVATGSYMELHLAHLTKAAVHLSEAGLAEEAASVNVLATKLRHELIATKQAQIAELQAEIVALEADCDAVCRAPLMGSAVAVPVCPPAACASDACEEPECSTPAAVPAPVVQEECGATAGVIASPPEQPQPPKIYTGYESRPQVLLKVKVVELSVTRMKKLGLVLPAMQAGAAMPGEVFTDLLETLERQHVAKVIDSPTLLLSDRRSGSFMNGGQIAVPKPGGKAGECIMQEIGTRVDARAMLLDDNRVRIEVRPRVAHLLSIGEHGPNVCVRELDAGFDTELGKTVVLGGLPQERMLKEKDPETLEDRQVHDVRETYFLLTPYAVDKPSTVQPVSHEEVIGVPAAGIRNFTARRRAPHSASFSSPQGEPLPKLNFTRPVEERVE